MADSSLAWDASNFAWDSGVIEALETGATEAAMLALDVEADAEVDGLAVAVDDAELALLVAAAGFEVDAGAEGATTGAAVAVAAESFSVFTLLVSFVCPLYSVDTLVPIVDKLPCIVATLDYNVVNPFSAAS